MMVWLLGLALAQSPQDTDFRGYVDQAEFFLRKDWYEDAEEQLALATEHPDGQHDPVVWYLLATTRLSLGDVLGAQLAADRAQTNARTLDQAQQAEQLNTYLATTYGVLVITGPQGTSARLDLQLDSLVFDAQAQEIAAIVREQARDKALLPRRIGLPAGTWQLNGDPVVIPPGETVTLPVPEGGGPSPLLTLFDRAEVEVGIGLAGWQGQETADLFPAPEMRVALSWPVGPIDLAVTGSWRPQAYQRRDGSALSSAASGGFGLRLGLPLPELEPWIVRPALTGRIAWIPGIPMNCLRSEADYTCDQDGPSDVLLYGVGRAWVPGAELTVARLERRRQFSIGFGMQARLERAFGTLPTAGAAQSLSDGAPLRYTTDPSERDFRAVGWSTMATVFMAL